MACYAPLHAFKAKAKDASKTLIVFQRRDSFRGERIDLPCGQCIGCRLEKSRQWAIRCMHEASMYEKNCFITLTYDQKNLPSSGSLVLEHFQLFMKRLRKKYGSSKTNPIRFYHCGEYGEALARPHYHALLFNHDFEDRVYFSKRSEHAVYTSDQLSGLWTKGFSVIGDLSFESAAYVARYAMKKITGERSEEHYGGRKPEYSTMSRRPGIGAPWFGVYSGDVYPRDGVVVRGRVGRPPRFYDTLLGKKDPSELALVKIKREYSPRDWREVCMDRLMVREEVARAALQLKSRYKDGG